jgi:mannose-6-phosphate isomerase-like protein (cupin superfamily)
MSRPYLVLRADDIEPFSLPDDHGYLSQHILGRESAGVHDTLLNRGTVRARYALGGGNHPDNDEVYVAVSGRSWVDLGGEPSSGAGCETYLLEPGMVVVVPAGTFHRLHNEWDEDFVLLSIWPHPAAPGANGIHDERLKAWGTGFRLREGRELVAAGDGTRVVDPGTGWDPKRG